MPLQQRTTVLPAPGKAPEVRQLLTEWVGHRHSQGRRVSLGQRLFSTEGVGLTVTTLAEDLATLDRFRQEDAGSADFASRAAKLAPLQAVPATIILLDQLVAGTPRPGTTIGQIATFHPTPAGIGPMRSALEAFVRDRQATGIFISLWQRLFSSDGATFAIYARYPDLAELDKSRQASRQAVSDLGVALAPHSRAPVQVRLWETIVSMPPPR